MLYLASRLELLLFKPPENIFLSLPPSVPTISFRHPLRGWGKGSKPELRVWSSQRHPALPFFFYNPLALIYAPGLWQLALESCRSASALAGEGGEGGEKRIEGGLDFVGAWEERNSAAACLPATLRLKSHSAESPGFFYFPPRQRYQPPPTFLFQSFSLLPTSPTLLSPTLAWQIGMCAHSVTHPE